MHRVVIIDGRSGSGKTVLAEQLAGQIESNTDELPAQVLHLDDLYPGWEGLATGSQAVAQVLRSGYYRKYDWASGEYSGPRIVLHRDRPLIIEGCGALTVANLAAARAWAKGGAPRTIWMEADEDLRRHRALARDGDTFAPHWDEWAAQEDLHFAGHEPWHLAEEIRRVSEDENDCGFTAE